MTTAFVQARRALLQSAISDTDTSMTVTEFLDLSGNAIVQADIGTTGYGTLAPNTAKEEPISFTIDSNVAGTAVLTITRGLLGKQPYGTGGTAYSHNAGTEFILSNNPDLFNKLTAKDNEEVITADWKFPLDPSHDQNPVPKKYLEDNAVMKTGAQTVEGVKTFTDSPVIPDADADNEPYNKGQVDALDEANVKLTGDQTIAGVKTFSSSPVVPSAVSANQPITKEQFDAAGESFSAVASDTVRGTTKLDTAADDPLDPQALTATADRVGALEGAQNTPDADNKFVTEDDLSDPTFKAPQVVTFTSSGTWTKDAGLKYVVVETIGGGGAGGGVSNSGRGGAGGGAGGYSRRTILASALGATETVTVGAGGTGVSGNTGNDGGTTSFGTLVQATGGSGGEGSSANCDGGAGGVGSIGDINTNGGGGGMGNSNLVSGAGGCSFLGGGAPGKGGVGDGITASVYGGGGSGALSGGIAQTGGAGSDGIVIVTEYYS